MKRDIIKICFLELVLIIILFFALFASKIFNRIILSIVMLVYMIIVVFFLKKRKIKSINKKQVTILMTIFAMVYLGLFYLMGVYFGFERSKISLSFWSLYRFIMPLSIIIIASEIIRNVFLSQKFFVEIKTLKINLSLLFTYLSMVLVDLLIYTGVYDLDNLNDFLVALGFVLFASLSCNLLFNYISKRYGSTGIIIFRLITVLFGYIIPIVPSVYLFFRTFLRMIYPYIIYVILEKLFSKYDFAVSYNDKKKEFVGNTFLIVGISLLVMLISCQFKYGILVIGSSSMTGSINKGDAVIFESYDNQNIKIGQVIIFDYNDIQTVHRVVDIREVNGEIRYFTRGDANKNNDSGYATADEIHGLVKLRVKYIGYPTLWVRNLFKKV